MNSERSSAFLMANVYSEIAQIFLFSQNREKMLSAISRARSILEKIRTLQEMQGRDFEIDILTGVIEDLAAPERTYTVTESQLASYFEPFIARAFSPASR